jgi:TBCC domain-containing protein 1
MSGDMVMLSGDSLAGLSSASPSSDDVVLTAKQYPFGGAVLSPKHAQELTPTLCMGIVSSLSEQSYRKHVIPYTLWITEAWRVLGWAEPSAALFWEMATMYHTLYLAGRAYAADYRDPQQIPPILSCGSQSSMGSGNTHTVSEHKKKFSSAASAKELPVWLVGTFLLLHCEETAVSRNLSGHDERRFYGNPSTSDSYSTEKMDFKRLLQHPALSPRYEATGANICIQKSLLLTRTHFTF